MMTSMVNIIHLLRWYDTKNEQSASLVNLSCWSTF